jgi:hypothetical protein
VLRAIPQIFVDDLYQLQGFRVTGVGILGVTTPSSAVSTGLRFPGGDLKFG